MEPQKAQISQQSPEKKRTKPKPQNNAGGFTIPDLEVQLQSHSNNNYWVTKTCRQCRPTEQN